MKINIELDIEINPQENAEAVLKGYFKHQSHTKGRKVIGFIILDNSEVDEVKNSRAEALAKARAAKAAKATENKEGNKEENQVVA